MYLHCNKSPLLIWRPVIVAGSLFFLLGCQSIYRSPHPHHETAYNADPILPQGCAITQDGLRDCTISWSKAPGRPYSYRIERSETPTGHFLAVKTVNDPNSALQYIDKSTPDLPLKDYTTYYYRLVAITPEGTESEPTMALATLTAPRPNPPTNMLAIAPSSRCVDLSWGPPQSRGIVQYAIERAVDSETGCSYRLLTNVSTNYYCDGGTNNPLSLEDSTRYLYRVTAINSGGSDSLPSEPPAAVITLPCPEVVRGFQAKNDEVRCVPLSWAANAEPDIDHYDIYRATSSNGPFRRVAAVVGCTNTYHLDGGGDPGNLQDVATYFYKIRAVNNVQSASPDSPVIKATTRSVPLTVGAIGAAAKFPRSVPLVWAASEDDRVIGYEIWRATNDGEWDQIAKIKGRLTTNYWDRGGAGETNALGKLADNVKYSYRVIAYNTANARSEPSAIVSATTKKCPQPPMGLSATTHLPRAVNLTWQANGEADVLYYEVASSDMTEGFKTFRTVDVGEKLRILEDNLIPGQTRYYRIKAWDKDGLDSDWSAIAEGKVKPLPAPPTHLQWQKKEEGFLISWQAPVGTDLAYYEVLNKQFFHWQVVTTTAERAIFLCNDEVLKSSLLSVRAIDRDHQEGLISSQIVIKVKNP